MRAVGSEIRMLSPKKDEKDLRKGKQCTIDSR